MFHRKLKLAAAILAGGTVLSLHAQMAQDPLLSRTAAVEPNIVFMFDDSGSMPATAIYQYGGSPGGFGMTGPGYTGYSDSAIFNIMINPPTTYQGQSPDVNRIYYDPRTSYPRRITANGTYMAAGSTSAISSFKVYFYKPPSPSNTYNVNGISVLNKGANYPATGITATFPAPPAGGTQATATVQTATSPSVGSVTVLNRGSGYPATGVTATFSAPGGGGTTAVAGTVQIGSSLTVTGTTVSAKGRDYPSSGVTATFSAPTLPGGVAAAGTVVMDGTTNKVTGATATNIGSGYISAPTVVFAAPPAGGTLATGTAVLTTWNRVSSISVLTGGCYSTSAAATLSGGVPVPGTVAPTLSVNFGSSCGGGRKIITSIGVSGGSGGYDTTPTLTVSGANTTGTFLLNMGAPITSVTGITITGTGSGYTSNPAISFSGGGGSGAAFTPVMATSYRIGSITLTNAGIGYTSAPSITINTPSTGTGGSAAVTTTAATNSIIGITPPVNGGSGYTSAPTITLSGTGSGSGATFAVTLGTTNVISGITVTNSGAGYTSTPTLAMTLFGDAPGAGATFGYTYNTVPVQPPNETWDGTGSPTNLSNYFSPSYTPDANGPLFSSATLVNYPNVADSTTTSFPKFKNRTDCAGTTCTWTEERQNYANWKTYHSTRLDLAKTGIGLAFQPLNPTFRLGWGTINTLANSNRLDKGVRLYNSTVQSDFLTWLYAIPANGSTPNRIALDKVGAYYKRADNGGPWANTPAGDTALSSAASEDTGHATCRRSYAMLMTDGYYNDSYSIGDQDTSTGPKITSPTTYQYTPIGPFSDTKSGTPFSNSFADVAMKYWLTDLRPNLPNNIRSVPGDEAYWQHMNFYAIGLGLIGTLDSTDPAVLAKLSGNGSTTPQRSLDWPTPAANDPKSIDDMWHAAVNGRGKMLNAKTTEELNNSILQMMSDIGGKEGTQSGVAVSTASLTKDTKKYTPSYTPITWNGNVTAYTLDSTSGNQTGIAWQVETLLTTDPVSGAKTYSSLIPSAASRNIYVGNGATSGLRSVPFTYTDMSAAGLLSAMNGTVNAGLIDYLRGDATNEDVSSSTASSTAIYRARATRLADIVNSTPVFVKDSIDLNYDNASGPTGKTSYRTFVNEKKARLEGLLFVGANDGMLHAFRDGRYDPLTGAMLTQGGVETFAYVPKALLPTLNQLADKTYVHRFYVDGPHVETDAYFGTGASATGWANVVVGTTGGGAGAASSAGVSPRTAVYAIDVTSINSSPNSLAANSVLWEVSSSNPSFSELGYVLTDVAAGPTRDGQWVAIFGNGYESKSCQARLFVVNIKTGALIKEINTNKGDCTTNKNGLGGVRIVRNTGQEIIGVYAGDLLGNVWKFSLNDTNPANWKVDLGGSPLFAASSTQPITAAPSVLTLPVQGATDPAPGYMVVIGTGKFYEVADITTTTQQSLYGIWDPLAFGAVTIPLGTALTNKSLLVQQSIGAGQIAPNGNTYYPISTNSVTYTGASARRGWYIDFPKTGQRLVYPLDLLSGRFAAADTISPANVSLDPCSNTTGGTGYFYIVDALTGSGPTEPILDTNGDGNVDSLDLVVSGLEGKADGRNVTLEVTRTASATTYVNVSGGSPGGTTIKISCALTNTCLNLAPTKIKSREWRQLFMR
jgi:type IV pilus assembly protein PilY1